jgi:hypothetical protein
MIVLGMPDEGDFRTTNRVAGAVVVIDSNLAGAKVAQG